MPKPRKPATAVREPIQVYLTEQDRGLLDRAAKSAGLSRAEVLRLGLRRIGTELLASENPVPAFLKKMAEGDWPAEMPTDVGARRDDYLADIYADRHEHDEK